VRVWSAVFCLLLTGHLLERGAPRRNDRGYVRLDE
jgi:hypothetical protein